MKKKWILLLLITISFTSLTAQDALYPNTFPLRDVRITAGPFKHACDLNVKVLLQYDTDRLLAPFLREAGLPKKAETYGNWEKDGLDGHIGGHYTDDRAKKDAYNREKVSQEPCRALVTWDLSKTWVWNLH